MHPTLFGFICLSTLAVAAVAVAVVSLAARRRAEHRIDTVFAAFLGESVSDIAPGAVADGSVEAICEALRWYRSARADLDARKRQAAAVSATAIRMLDPADVATVLRFEYERSADRPWEAAAARILSIAARVARTSAEEPEASL